MEILDIFKKITSIPHCSKNTLSLQKFIIDFAKQNNYFVEVDSVGNILCYKQKREISLQSHYDMVCVGKAPNIEIVEKDGFLMAKDSSLGADNGIGVALMLSLISKGVEAEYLFTNDEEIGLIGANEIELKLKSKYMINLDSEELGAIFIGCAGGVDIFASKKAQKGKIQKKFIYKIETFEFEGGHSGVDIDKDIPNAIKVLANILTNIKDYELIRFKGGERINSIPSKAKAIIAVDKKIDNFENVSLYEMEKEQDFCIVEGEKLIKILAAFPHGVRGCDFELKIPKTSINLALVDLNINELNIALSARSMNKKELNNIEIETKLYFSSFGFKNVSEGKYPPWEPKITDFSMKVKKIYQKYFKDVKFKAIHAGLESAVLSSKFPNIQIVSIGPNIYNPHSKKEKVEIKSISILYDIVKDIVRSFN